MIKIISYVEPKSYFPFIHVLDIKKTRQKCNLYANENNESDKLIFKTRKN